MKSHLVFIASLLIATPACAGTIVGTVSAKGKLADTEQGGGDGYESRRYKFMDRVDYDAITGFVVHVDGISHPPEGNTPTAKIEQRDGTFVPHILPIVAGTQVSFPNRDDIFHNVFSMSETTPFDLGLYKKDDVAKTVTFYTPGRVDVFCSIHTRMNCIVLILQNPWFDLADRRGRFRIENVPAGTYNLRAWHERMPAKIVEVTVPDTGEISVDIAMGFDNLPKL